MVDNYIETRKEGFQLCAFMNERQISFLIVGSLGSLLVIVGLLSGYTSWYHIDLVEPKSLDSSYENLYIIKSIVKCTGSKRTCQSITESLESSRFVTVEQTGRYVAYLLILSLILSLFIALSAFLPLLNTQRKLKNSFLGVCFLCSISYLLTCVVFAMDFTRAYKEDMDRLAPKIYPCTVGPCKSLWGSDVLLGNVTWSWGPAAGWYLCAFGCILAAIITGAASAVKEANEHWRVN